MHSEIPQNTFKDCPPKKPLSYTHPNRITPSPDGHEGGQGHASFALVIRAGAASRRHPASRHPRPTRAEPQDGGQLRARPAIRLPCRAEPKGHAAAPGHSRKGANARSATPAPRRPPLRHPGLACPDESQESGISCGHTPHPPPTRRRPAHRPPPIP